jgi:hypothetical protein
MEGSVVLLTGSLQGCMHVSPDVGARELDGQVGASLA